MSKNKYDIVKAVLKKHIYLKINKSKYCVVHLFNYRYDMQQAYLKYCISRGLKGEPVKGASCHYEKIKTNNGKYILSPETGHRIFKCRR